MSMSRFKKLSILFTVALFAVASSGCGFYTRVMTQKNLVDGAAAYNERNFDEAIERFERAVSYDPELTSVEANTAQLFLARTLHSLFAGNRGQTEKATRAIEEYRKALPGFVAATKVAKESLDANPDDEKAKNLYESNKNIAGSIVSAIGSLYENLQKDDDWQKWQEASAANAELPSTVRANSFVALAAKNYSCANEITDGPPVKKTVVKDGSPVFEFSKPESDETFDKLKGCVEKGTEYITKAVELNPDSDSAWSYKASLLLQKMRIAEMNGESDEKEKYKKESEEAKAKFEELAEKRRKEEEEAARKKAEEIGGQSKGAGEGEKKAEPEAKKE